MSSFLKQVWRRVDFSRGVALPFAALPFAALPCAALPFAACAALVGCGSSDDATEVGVTPEDLANRAYVISEASNELFVVDLSNMSEVGKVDTSVGIGPNANHMSMLNLDGSKMYITASEQDTLVVVDTTTLEVIRQVPLGAHPTHAETCPGCGVDGHDQLWVVNEGGEHSEEEGGAGEPGEIHPGSVSIIDMVTDEVVRTFSDPSLVVPHFVRFHDRTAYIPSIGGNQITVLNIDSFQVEEVLVLDGATGPGACSGDPCGFADAQIDQNGLLVAAHIETGHVLSYDTVNRARRPDLITGNRPWSIFVDSLSNVFDTHLMPNWGDSTVSLIDRVEQREVARSPEGDQESYGVNYSPLAEGEAFVLNSVKERVAIIDRMSGELIEALDVGGTTETASTTGDGRFLLLPLSSSNQFAVYDVSTHAEVARFDDVGTYPWSVTTVGGQNYCH
jgi:YVTN family beta-propeller protein